MHLSHMIPKKNRYHYLYIALAFCILGILDAFLPMPWWVRFSGYGVLLIAAALRSGKAVNFRRAEVELLRAKEAAEAANEAKSLFLANMSHEIRTPINSILSFVEILLNEPLTGSQRESVELMKLSAETLLSLIDEILDFSKIESDSIQLDETVIDLKKLVLDAMGLVRAQVESKGVALKCHFPAVIPSVMGDPLRLRQVLLNLLGNALKFTDEGEIVTTVRILEEHEKDLFLKFSVADTGIGIPEGKLEHVFEVFSQADASITKRFGGTGLGLAICRRLIDLMGGEIGVQSAVEKGSVFYFQIPLMKAPPPTMAANASMETASGENLPETAPDSISRRLRILLAEDDVPVQRITSLLLERQMGHRVDIAHNGTETVEMALAAPYDIILMDVNMPLLDGVEATRKIRAAGCEIPIVALTANVMNGIQEKFLRVGMDGYLSKPINAKRFTDAFQKFCGGRMGGSGESTEFALEESRNDVEGDVSETTEDLAQRVSLSSDDYGEILTEFIAVKEADIQKLCDTFKEGDTDSVCQLAHKIKGSAKALALDDIADSTSKIEQAVRDGDLPEAEIALHALKRAFEDLKERE